MSCEVGHEDKGPGPCETCENLRAQGFSYGPNSDALVACSQAYSTMAEWLLGFLPDGEGRDSIMAGLRELQADTLGEVLALKQDDAETFAAEGAMVPSGSAADVAARTVGPHILPDVPVDTWPRKA